MKIFAHRGVFDCYPENSHEALGYALSQGFSIETDLRLTLDGDFAIIHDDNLYRLCGKDIPVRSLTLARLEQHRYVDNEKKKTAYRLNSFRRYCELLENTSPELEIALHLKADSQTEEGLCKISNYFGEFDLYRKAFVLGLTLQAATVMRKVDPEIRIALMISEYKFEPTIYLWSEIKDFRFEIVWAAEHKRLYSRGLIDEVRDTGRVFYAVSPDVHKEAHILHPLAYRGYEKTWDDLICWGVDGICTDLSSNLRERLASDV